MKKKIFFITLAMILSVLPMTVLASVVDVGPGGSLNPPGMVRPQPTPTPTPTPPSFGVPVRPPNSAVMRP